MTPEKPQDPELDKAAEEALIEADAPEPAPASEEAGVGEAAAAKPKRRRVRRTPKAAAAAQAEEAGQVGEGAEAPAPKARPAKAKAKAPAEEAPPAPAPARERKPASARARRRVVRARARYVRTPARKARVVCAHLPGKSVAQARAILAFTPREVARDWSKLLESAVANAENNHELLEEDLIIREAYADEGPTIKRFRPRAMGRATPIRKRTSHLTITLSIRPEETNRAN
jgi:ribosomal protein L22